MYAFNQMKKISTNNFTEISELWTKEDILK